MIDNITCRLYHDGIEEWNSNAPIVLNGLSYYPYFKNNQVAFYKADIKNIQVIIYQNAIILRNSLHKFYHGNNYCDFNCTELICTVDALCDITGFNWWEADITRMEYGMNVLISAENDVIQSLMLFKSKEFLAMISKAKKYGKVCEQTNYKLKCYDKTLQYKLVEKQTIPNNIIRCEIVVTKMAYLSKRKLPIEINCLKNLKKPEVLQLLLEDLISKFKDCAYSNNYNLEGLTANEKKIYAIMTNPELSIILKCNNPHTYRRDRKTFRKIISKGRNVTNEFFMELEVQKNKLLK